MRQCLIEDLMLLGWTSDGVCRKRQGARHSESNVLGDDFRVFSFRGEEQKEGKCLEVASSVRKRYVVEAGLPASRRFSPRVCFTATCHGCSCDGCSLNIDRQEPGVLSMLSKFIPPSLLHMYISKLYVLQPESRVSPSTCCTALV